MFCLIELDLKSFNCLSYELKEEANALPASRETILADTLSGLLATSCKESKNLPINVPKSLLDGNNMFSKSLNFDTKSFNFSWSDVVVLVLSERYASKDLLIFSTLTPNPDWSATLVAPPEAPAISVTSAARLLYPSVLILAIFCPVTDKACL